MYLLVDKYRTFSPDANSVKNNSDHIKIPVVSLSDPPLHENPVNGASGVPSHSEVPSFSTY